MRAADSARLVALAAIWGAAFLFVRIVSPVIGPWLTTDMRTLIAGIALLAWLRATRYEAQWRRWGRAYVVIGIFNSALPFLLFAYAALTLTAGLMSVLNATAPMFAALMSAALLGERLSGRRIAGLTIGVVGVAIVTRPDGSQFAPLAVAACLAAACSYGFAGAYLRRWARDAPPRGLAAGTQLAAGFLLLPFAAAALPDASVFSPVIVACLLALGLACGAVAFILYFRLMVDIGSTGTLTVTYLIPLFGTLFGAVFLGETVTAAMVGGMALVLAGTYFVLKN
jgi:drug/metabolite transporter (DMT)-like permease